MLYLGVPGGRFGARDAARATFASLFVFVPDAFVWDRVFDGQTMCYAFSKS